MDEQRIQINYKRLWKMLIDKDMSKSDLREKTNILASKRKMIEEGESMYNILLVEDDLDIQDMINDYLTGDNFAVTVADTGEKALTIFLKDSFDLVLVDLMLPKCDGFEVIKRIRKSSTIPIIIVTAKDSDIDKTRGFHMGADDYVNKPFSLIELSARIKANIRRATCYQEKRSDEIIKIHDLTIYVSEYRVEQGGKPLHLTHKEFDILCLLAQNMGRAFSKEQIYNQLWNEAYYGNEGVLNSHMNRLRNKLRDGATEEKEYIKTMWGIGYKMEAK